MQGFCNGPGAVGCWDLRILLVLGSPWGLGGLGAVHPATGSLLPEADEGCRGKGGQLWRVLPSVRGWRDTGPPEPLGLLPAGISSGNFGQAGQTPGSGGASLGPAVCSCLGLVLQPVSSAGGRFGVASNDASPQSPSLVCLLGGALGSLLCTLVQWLWLCPVTLPLPPARLCTGMEFLGDDGIVSAYLGLATCPGCSCLPLEEGGSRSQDLPFGELLTPNINR